MKICSRMSFGLLLKVATLVVLHGTNNPNHVFAAKVVLRGSLSQENHLNELREEQERRRLQDVAATEAPSTTSVKGTPSGTTEVTEEETTPLDKDDEPSNEDPPDEDLQDEDTTETTPDPTPAPTVEGQTAAPTMEPSTSPTVSEVIIIRPPPPAQLRNPLLNRPVYATNNGPSQLKYLKTNIIRPSISIPVDRQRTIPRETINRLPPYLISQTGGFARLGDPGD